MIIGHPPWKSSFQIFAAETSTMLQYRDDLFVHNRLFARKE
jgi:hypothetical protein